MSTSLLLLFTVALLPPPPTTTLTFPYPDSYNFDLPTDECPIGFRSNMEAFFIESFSEKIPKKRFNMKKAAELSSLAIDYAKSYHLPAATDPTIAKYRKHYILKAEIVWPEVFTSESVNVKWDKIVEPFTKQIDQLDVASIISKWQEIRIGFGCYLTTSTTPSARTQLRLVVLIGSPKSTKRPQTESWSFTFPLPSNDCPIYYGRDLHWFLRDNQHQLMKDVVPLFDADDLAASYASYLYKSKGKRVATFHRYRTLDVEIRWPKVFTSSSILVKHSKIFQLFNMTLPQVIRSPPAYYGVGCHLGVDSGETILRLTFLAYEKPTTRAPTTRLPLVTCPAPPPCPAAPTCPTPVSQLPKSTCPPPKVCPPSVPVTCPTTTKPIHIDTSSTNTAIWSGGTRKLVNGQLTFHLLFNLPPRCQKKKLKAKV